jgi:hypothetical protein
LPSGVADAFGTALSEVDEERARRYPGDRLANQPVHTCYVPAGAARPDLLRHWGSSATEALTAHAATPADLAELAGLPAQLAEPVHELLLRKLATQPVEDLRFDFEDGYGTPGDDTEDADALRAARILADWHRAARTLAAFRCGPCAAARSTRPNCPASHQPRSPSWSSRENSAGTSREIARENSGREVAAGENSGRGGAGVLMLLANALTETSSRGTREPERAAGSWEGGLAPHGEDPPERGEEQRPRAAVRSMPRRLAPVTGPPRGRARQRCRER